MNIIDVRKVTFSYDEKLVLDNIDMPIKKGSMTAVLGQNGAGKSTLFLNMNGVLKPDSGQVFLNNEPVTYDKKGIGRLRRSVGIVFQDPNDQLFSANVKKDVSFGAMNMGLSLDETEQRVSKALQDTGMIDYADTPTHALSFGQKKRVAIAGVLVMRPDVLILDEPTAGLDPIGVSGILKLLERIRREDGMTVIISTHDIDIVPLYCDYVYVMDSGRVVMNGTPEDIFTKPDELRRYSLRLPRIAHLMEILKDYDNILIDEPVSTISAARRVIKRLVS